MQSLLDNKALMVGAGLFALVVGLLLLLALIQMLFRGKLRLPGGRTRQARLGIVDAFDLDRQRQLIIVRRDNTEHLIMIGGPNDLLIEAEISRVESRESRRDKFEAALPGAVPPPGFGEPRVIAPYAPVPDRLEPQVRPVTPVAPVRTTPVTPPVVPPLAKAPAPAAPVVPPPSPSAEPAPLAAPPLGAAPVPAAPSLPPLTVAPPQAPVAAGPLPGVTRQDPEKRPSAAFSAPPRRPAMPIDPRPAAKPAEAGQRIAPPPAAETSSAPGDGPSVAPAPATAPAGSAGRVPSQFLRPRTPLQPAPRPAPAPAASPVPQPRPPAVTEVRDQTLESLEEEMAKLLGRGSGES